MIVLQTLGLGAAMVAALYYFGYGVARVALPARLGAWRVLLTPFFGLALVAVWDYSALFFGVNLTYATWALVAATFLANGFVLIQQRRARANAVTQTKTSPRNFNAREQWFVVALAVVAFAAAVAPLWRYGYATIIGENWDYEFYLPLADLLRALPTAALVNAPSNPLLSTILSRHILPLPMGFSYVQASLDVLTQQQAMDSFAVLLGVLRALGVVAAFLFFRATLKMSARASLASATLLALNGLLLWFTYWSFGLHLASLALLPVTLLFGAHALMERETTRVERARAIFTAGFFLGALNVTYHPALVAVALPLLAIGLYQLFFPKQRVAIFLRGLAIIGLTIAFSFPTLFHLADFVREYYGRAPLAIGLREFVPLSDGYGLSLYLLDLAVGHTIPTPWLYEWYARTWNVGALWLTLAAVAASLYALWELRVDKERRVVWYLIVGASVFYVALFRLPFLRPYPYGFLKSISLVSYILIAVAVHGADALVSFFRLRFAPGRFVMMAGCAAFAFLTLATFALSVEQYFKPRPAFFDAEALSLRATQTDIEPRAEIFLTDNARVQKIPMGLAAYALLQNNLYGNVTTGYGALNNAQAGRVYDVALLARGEDPTLRGYQNQAVWSNATFALYPRARGVLVHKALNAQIGAPHSLTFTLGAQEIISGTEIISATRGTRNVTIALASFVPQRVNLTWGATQTQIELTPGVTTITRAQVALPATLYVTPTVASEILDAASATTPHRLPQTDPTLFVPYIQLAQAGATPTQQNSGASALVRCTNQNAPELDARCFVVNPNGETFTWRWIVRGTLAGTHEERVLAQTEIAAAPRQAVDILARPNGAMLFGFDGNAPQTFSYPALPDGKYRGALEILRGEILMARIPLYTFELQSHGASLVRDTNASALYLLAP